MTHALNVAVPLVTDTAPPIVLAEFPEKVIGLPRKFKRPRVTVGYRISAYATVDAEISGTSRRLSQAAGSSNACYLQCAQVPEAKRTSSSYSPVDSAGATIDADGRTGPSGILVPREGGGTRAADESPRGLTSVTSLDLSEGVLWAWSGRRPTQVHGVIWC